VILANLIPAAPFVILVMTPFIEQIDPNLESAARVFGAGTGGVFRHVLVPLLAPGHPGRVAARARAHDRNVRAHLPDGGFRFADTGRRAVLRGVRRRASARRSRSMRWQ
jgi:hypothetical protein